MKAIVTGASSGIGYEISKYLSKKGYEIIAVARDEGKLKMLKKECETNVDIFLVDLSNEDEIMKFYDNVKNEKVDVLVNNAGITRDTLLMRMKEEDFDAVINTNLKGCFNMMKAVNKIMMKQRSGAIINMSSVIGLAGNIGQVNYAASKAGVLGMTYSVAKELAARNITCNAIAPGMIATDMTEVLSDKVKEQILEEIPLKRFGQPEEIAETALFLAKSKYITGQVITVDGGMVIGR